MSERVNSGKSTTISSGVIPPARYSKTSWTVIRSPRTQGFPLRLSGSMVIIPRYSMAGTYSEEDLGATSDPCGHKAAVLLKRNPVQLGKLSHCLHFLAQIPLHKCFVLRKGRNLLRSLVLALSKTPRRSASRKSVLLQAAPHLRRELQQFARTKRRLKLFDAAFQSNSRTARLPRRRFSSNSPPHSFRTAPSCCTRWTADSSFTRCSSAVTDNGTRHTEARGAAADGRWCGDGGRCRRGSVLALTERAPRRSRARELRKPGALSRDVGR